MTKIIQLMCVCVFILCGAAVVCAAALDAQALTDLSALPDHIQRKLIQQYQQQSGGSVSIVENVKVESIPEANNTQSSVVADSLPTDLQSEQKGSSLERQYRHRYQSHMAAEISQFGYNLFDISSSQVTSRVVPDNDYRMAPGDQIRIRLWGALEDIQYVATVNDDGTVNVPKIGIVNVLGEQLGQLDSVIKKEVAKYMQGVHVKTALENLHSVEVYVVGEVAKPGLYMVPAFSTIFNSLQVAGGVNKVGSLRQITLHRLGKSDSQLDLYNLMLNGSRAADQVLKDGDVVFVPRIGSTVAVVGAVVQPAIFELKHEKNLQQLLALAGNLLPNAYSKTAYLKYYDEQNIFQVEDIQLAEKKTLARNLSSGLVLEIPYVQEDRSDAVQLIGHVKMVQTVKYRRGLKIDDVLHSVNELKPEALLDYALIHRYNADTTRYEIQKFPLQSFLTGDYNLSLQPRDQIEILSRAQFGIEEKITVAGAVWQTGDFTFSPGMSVAEAIALAGGTQLGARIDRVEISRIEINDDKSDVNHLVLNLAAQQNLLLQPYDYVFIPRVKDATRIATVKLGGEVRYPGTYSISDGDHLSQVIKRAGGFTDQAYFYGSVFTSPLAQEIQQSSLDKMIATLKIEVQRNTADLEQAAGTEESVMAAHQSSTTAQNIIRQLESTRAMGRISVNLAPLTEFVGSSFDLELHDGDSLNVPMKPSFVSVVGSVYSPNSFLYLPGLTVADYLEKSGGPTKGAAEDYIYIQRANGEVLSIQQMGMFGNFYSKELMPGDTIVVLEDLERVPGLRLFKDLTEIIFHIATSAGIVFAI